MPRKFSPAQIATCLAIVDAWAPDLSARMRQAVEAADGARAEYLSAVATRLQERAARREAYRPVEAANARVQAAREALEALPWHARAEAQRELDAASASARGALATYRAIYG